VRRKYDKAPTLSSCRPKGSKKIGHRSVVHPPVYSHPFIDTSSFSSIFSRENLQRPVLSRLPGGTRRCRPAHCLRGRAPPPPHDWGTGRRGCDGASLAPLADPSCARSRHPWQRLRVAPVAAHAEELAASRQRARDDGDETCGRLLVHVASVCLTCFRCLTMML
jgi:hypothetical protein